MAPSISRKDSTKPDPALALPGDDLIPGAGLVFDRAATFDAPAAEVWPWVQQLGKSRGGWYMPSRIERLVVWSRRRRAATAIDPRWQRLEVGDRIPDYGGKDEEFEVCEVDPPHVLVYRSSRDAGTFSWALVLSELSPGRTLLHARFRGTLTSTGLKRKAISTLGDLFDAATIELMFAGLRERVERPHR